MRRFFVSFATFGVPLATLALVAACGPTPAPAASASPSTAPSSKPASPAASAAPSQAPTGGSAAPTAGATPYHDPYAMPATISLKVDGAPVTVAQTDA